MSLCFTSSFSLQPLLTLHGLSSISLGVICLSLFFFTSFFSLSLLTLICLTLLSSVYPLSFLLVLFYLSLDFSASTCSHLSLLVLHCLYFLSFVSTCSSLSLLTSPCLSFFFSISPLSLLGFFCLCLLLRLSIYYCFASSFFPFSLFFLPFPVSSPSLLVALRLPWFSFISFPLSTFTVSVSPCKRMVWNSRRFVVATDHLRCDLFWKNIYNFFEMN